MSNTEQNQHIFKTPSQDGQGRWYELLSPTQVLTGQESILLQPPMKKKPRNRRLQRYWRKLRRQRVGKKMMKRYKHEHRQQQQQQQQEKIQEVDMEETIPLNETMNITNESMETEVCLIFLSF